MSAPSRKKVKRTPIAPNSQVVLAQRATAMKNMSIKPKTRASYESPKVQFIFHVLAHYPQLVNADFKRELADQKEPSRKFEIVAEKTRSFEPPAPLDFANVPPEAAENFIMSITKPDGSLMSLSTYKNARSAISDLYRSFGFVVPDPVNVALRTVMKGLQRSDAEMKGKEGLAVDSGKRPLEFSHFIKICHEFLAQGMPDDIFALLYTILGWNLVARCGNVGEICLNHMRWSDDALQIQFAHMKNDQEGQRAAYSRHVYANPIIPDISVALALGLYCIYTKYEPNSKRLFPGPDQAARYRAKLTAVLKKPHIQQLLAASGLTAEQIASHSLRKGAATMCCCGVVDGPHIAALMLRAGWSFPGVQGKYIQFEAAGDQFVGRTVAGLPLLTCEFAALPPRFVDENDPLVLSTIKEVFCFRPPGFDGILSKALASLVYHEKYLRQTLKPQHPLFKHALFADPSIIDSLRPKVVAGLPHEARDHIVATGIPGRIYDRLAIAQLSDRIGTIIPQLTAAIEGSEKRINEAITKVLEDNAVTEGILTPTRLREELAAVLAVNGVTTNLPDMIRSIIEDTVQRFAPGAIPQPSGAASASSSLTLPLLAPDYKLPEEFSFSGFNVQTAWQMYCRGVPAQGVPPLRFLVRRNTDGKSQNARLGDFRYLFKPLEASLKADKKWIPQPFLAQTNEMFRSACHVLEVPSKTPTGKARERIGQMGWKTAVEALRWKEAHPDAAAAAAAAPDFASAAAVSR